MYLIWICILISLCLDWWNEIFTTIPLSSSSDNCRQKAVCHKMLSNLFLQPHRDICLSTWSSSPRGTFTWALGPVAPEGHLPEHLVQQKSAYIHLMATVKQACKCCNIRCFSDDSNNKSYQQTRLTSTYEKTPFVQIILTCSFTFSDILVKTQTVGNSNLYATTPNL